MTYATSASRWRCRNRSKIGWATRCHVSGSKRALIVSFRSRADREALPGASRVGFDDLRPVDYRAHRHAELLDQLQRLPQPLHRLLVHKARAA